MGSRSTWSRSKHLGKGSYGSVFLGLHKNGTMFAVKTAKLENSNSLVKEKKILKHIGNSPEIVRYYGDEITIEKGIQYYNLFLEYASYGDLLKLINKVGGRIPKEGPVQVFTRMILDSLCCIHAKGIVHCDIKPENILVFSSDRYGCRCQLKIADFGLAKEASEAALESKKYAFCGTPDYMPPESVALFYKYETSMDIWSLGCVVLVMFTGKSIWSGTDGKPLDREEIIQILASTETMPEIPKEMSETGKDFLGKCLQRDPSKRWSAQKLLDHPYVSPFSLRNIEFLKEYPTAVGVKRSRSY
ncbi:hypothetical protein TIFTF001_030554 [Ficus carica]|uniref:Protein kinase domain-containing protein n=1 Tax=Ficus carica TaxID=3494 RepID=A0AA88DU15_FICCA|nr:hypothetical protein TIFTF001_030554 [Ficus carica]